MGQVVSRLVPLHARRPCERQRGQEDHEHKERGVHRAQPGQGLHDRAGRLLRGSRPRGRPASRVPRCRFRRVVNRGAARHLRGFRSQKDQARRQLDRHSRPLRQALRGRRRRVRRPLHGTCRDGRGALRRRPAQSCRLLRCDRRRFRLPARAGLGSRHRLRRREAVETPGGMQRAAQRCRVQGR